MAEKTGLEELLAAQCNLTCQSSELQCLPKPVGEPVGARDERLTCDTPPEKLVLRLRCLSITHRGPSEELNHALAELFRQSQNSELEPWIVHDVPSPQGLNSTDTLIPIEVDFEYGDYTPATEGDAHIPARILAHDVCGPIVEDFFQQRNRGTLVCRNVFGRDCSKAYQKYYAFPKTVQNMAIVVRGLSIQEGKASWTDIFCEFIDTARYPIYDGEPASQQSHSTPPTNEPGQGSTSQASTQPSPDNFMDRLTDLISDLSNISNKIRAEAAAAAKPNTIESAFRDAAQPFYQSKNQLKFLRDAVEELGVKDPSATGAWDLICNFHRTNTAMGNLQRVLASMLPQLDIKHSTLHENTYKAVKWASYGAAGCTGLLLGAVALSAVGGPVWLTSWWLCGTVSTHYIVAGGGIAVGGYCGSSAASTIKNDQEGRKLIQNVRDHLRCITRSGTDFARAMTAYWFEIEGRRPLESVSSEQKRQLVECLGFDAECWPDKGYQEGLIQSTAAKFLKDQDEFLQAIQTLARHEGHTLTSSIYAQGSTEGA
ncbi:hypothetical protein IFR04_009458 [Cadophora malorum]|uniref:Uncharacterized protein n=1 Tax=Cadophora malorum TaxID=108018 RepID=A0A8H7WA83_9HELO|nr:hypothetical protein IFR04_009458 [Cadophora malorum]